MCYKSDTEAGLNEEDRRWLEKVLEEEFGYNLCIYERDVLPGEGAVHSIPINNEPVNDNRITTDEI